MTTVPEAKRSGKYKLTAPTQKAWIESEKRWDVLPPYPREAQYDRSVIFGVKIADGVGETDDAFVAVDFFDMGWAVEPDPHPEAIEIVARREQAAEEREAKEEAWHEAVRRRVREEQLNSTPPKAKHKSRQAQAA